MKKNIALKRLIDRLLRVSFAPFGLILSGLMLFSLIPAYKALGDDWTPRLDPPRQTKYRDDMDTSVEDEIDELEIDSIPRRLTRRSQSFQQLSGATNHRTTQPVRFDDLDPRGRVIPSRFLDEDVAMGSSETDSNPQPPKKNIRTKNLETGTRALPQANEAERGESNEIFHSGEVYYDDEYIVSNPMQGYGGVYDQCSPALDSCFACPPVVKPFGTCLLDNLTVFAGTTGFKSEFDGGNGGNFGIHEGFNWSIPVITQYMISAQLGVRAVQSNLRGSDFYKEKSCRNQYFVTAGVFRRDLCSPIQGGVAFDWFEDNFYGKIKVQQLRCELSARTFSNLEYGFQGGFGMKTSSNSYLNARENFYHNTLYQTFSFYCDDYYLMFGRKHFDNGGVAEARVGATAHGNVIISASAEFPINDRFSLNGGLTGMIPKESRREGGGRKETWDVSVGMIFYFRGGACTKTCNPCRPMFDVASNGSFMGKIKRGK